ncbi:MAG: DUF3048 domain-containing protein [Anaerolineae bacterium]
MMSRIRTLEKHLALLAFLLVTLLITARPSAAQDVIGPDTYPPGVNPLTGLPVENPELLNRRPLIVKIDNYPPDIRPQSGLNSADIVWETLLAGGVTRFGAIFLGEDIDHAGPVRSCRLADFELTRVYNSLFVCSGMAQGTLDRLRADALATSRSIVGGQCPPLCRFPVEGVAFEHTLFADTAGVRDFAAEMGRDTTPQPVSGMAFSADTPTSGTPLNALRVEYTQTEIDWAYDAVSGRWLRSQDGEAHFDALSGTQISAANVVVLEANHIEQPFVSDGYWGPPHYAVAIELTGSGRVLLLRDGQLIEGQWQRATETDPLTFVDADGNPLLFKPGNTFINLVPRWVDGYQLVPTLAQPLTATITYSDGIYLRHGPGQAYGWVAVGQPNETYPAVGRNRAGDWVQLLLPDGSAAWASLSLVNLSGDITSLPLVRSTFER